MEDYSRRINNRDFVLRNKSHKKDGGDGQGRGPAKGQVCLRELSERNLPEGTRSII